MEKIILSSSIQIILFLSLLSLLLFFKIKPYNYNFSSLVGIWSGFAEKNPGLVEKNFIIYEDGGYDGQFFYFIPKHFFSKTQNNLILDAYNLRLRRVGLPLIAGPLSNLFGWLNYSVITIAILLIFHILSFLVLKQALADEVKFLSLFYLFSPFSINSILLLVSDSLLASFAIFSFYFFIKENNFLLFSTLLFTCLIRETGIMIGISFIALSFFEKDFKKSFFILISLSFYVIIYFLLPIIYPSESGTNPLNFRDLSDYPLLGFWKSIFTAEGGSDWKSIARNSSKYIIFLYYILLIVTISGLRNLKEFFISIPILGVVFISTIAEQGYWLTFDNISRMFTICPVFLILLNREMNTKRNYKIFMLQTFILLMIVIRILFIKQAMKFYLQP